VKMKANCLLNDSRALLALAVLLCCAASLSAQDYEISGYLRSLLSRSKTINDVHYYSATHRWHSKLSYFAGSEYEFTLEMDNTLTWGDYLKTNQWELLQTLRREDAIDLSATWWNGTDGRLETSIFRGYARYSGERVDVSVGRQRIVWGSGRIWNPIDLFNPLDPLRVERDIQPGIDSMQFVFRPADTVQVEFVTGARFKDDDLSYALRLRKTLGTYDISLVAGSFDSNGVVGLDFSGYLGDAGLRGALVWHEGVEKNSWQALLSYEYVFPNGLDVLVEYLYNENTLESADLIDLGEIRDFSGIVTLNRHYFGVQLGGQVSPLINATVLSTIDLESMSWSLFPLMSINYSQNTDISLGLQIFGGNNGDFADQHNKIVIMLNYYL
jgi:hypothetical protein